MEDVPLGRAGDGGDRLGELGQHTIDHADQAASDPAEVATVRKNFLKGKLGLTQDDEVLDAAIAEVAGRMKADRTKSRATVYYLLAEKFDKLAVFR